LIYRLKSEETLITKTIQNISFTAYKIEDYNPKIGILIFLYTNASNENSKAQQVQLCLILGDNFS